MRTALALVLALPLAACAPERQGTPDGEGVPTNDFQTALFTILDYGGWAEYQTGTLVLVDAEVTCDQLQWGGSLDKWSIGADVDWVQANIQHGVLHNGWLRTYESIDRAAQNGTQNTDEVQSFWGEVGLGPLNDDFPDGPDEPVGTPTGERDVIAAIGTDQGMNDTLAVTLSDEETLGGELVTWQGTWSFAATKCGIVYDQVDGGTDPDGPPGTDDGDDAGGGGSQGSEGSP